MKHVNHHSTGEARQSKSQITNHKFQPTNQPTSSPYLRAEMGAQKIPIRHAIEYLDHHFGQVPSVEAWYKLMGYPNRQSFWRKFDARFHEAPRTAYIRKKIQMLVNYVRANPDCTAKEAALAIHHKNGNELSQFVTTKLGCNFTELKVNIRGIDGTGPIFVTKYGDIL